ncbi:MAG TPA: DUF4337 domain-containing protein [bacterium]|nr:DUF4337 domain-containing protein [bacterium]
MPEEIEVPTEHLHEAMEEKAHEGGGFNTGVALSSALIAVLAAVCALFAGGYANEALVARVKSSDQWSYYQAKGIKAAVLSSKLETLKALGHKTSDDDAQKAEQYKTDQKDISDKATELDNESELLLAKHEVLSKGVTLFQIAIALGAIAVLTKRKNLWFVSLLTSLGGIFFLVKGLFLL